MKQKDKKILYEFYNFARLFCKGNNNFYAKILHIGKQNLLATNGSIAMVSKNKPLMFVDQTNVAIDWYELNKFLLINNDIIFNNKDLEVILRTTKAIKEWFKPPYKEIIKKVKDINIDIVEGICKLNYENITWYLNSEYLTYALQYCDTIRFSNDPFNFTMFENENFLIVIMPLRMQEKDKFTITHEFSSLNSWVIVNKDEHYKNSIIEDLKDSLDDFYFEFKRLKNKIENI